MHAFDNAIRISLDELKQAAVHSNHRLLVVINGEQDWVHQFIRQYLQQTGTHDKLFISANELPGCTSVSYDKADTYLGNEFDTVIYDAYSGFFPSTFALTEGMLKGGGIMFLLTPALEHWSTYKDTFCVKYAMHPYSADQMKDNFIRRLAGIILHDKTISVISQHQPAKLYSEKQAPAVDTRPYSDDCLTADQQQAVEKIIHTARGHRNRPLVLLSNRGHGKSSALGIACAKLLLAQTHHITITGPRKNAASNVFRHAARVLGLQMDTAQSRLQYEQACIEFIAPDALLHQPVETALLMVDEAAALPLPLLESLLKQYHRIVFSSTVYGYEGNGRGFEIRFFKQLDKLCNNWSLFRLEAPVRWSSDDPLEAFCYKAFLLDSRLPEFAHPTEPHMDHIEFCRIDNKVLSENDDLLQQLFGLLTSAHYKTTPNDLRMIIDSPYVSIFCLQHMEHIIACALIATEGAIDDDLAGEILNGRRRSSGQLLPQTLISEHAAIDAARLRYARIMRIAVHPQLQGKGIGSQLLDHLYSAFCPEYDFIGASFGADERLFRFWNEAGYTTVKLGHKKNAYSGYHSLVVIKGLSATGMEIIARIGRDYPQRLLYLFTDSLKYLDPSFVYSLLVQYSSAIDMQLNNAEMQDLCTFAQASRNFDSCAHALYKLVLVSISRAASALDQCEWSIMIQRLVQRHAETEVIKANHLGGKAELDARLRTLTETLLQVYQQ